MSTTVNNNIDLPDLLNLGWGPTEDAIPSFSGLPFTPFSKRDPINYVANWDPTSSHRPSRRSHRSKYGEEVNAAQLGVFSESDNEDAFEGGITVQKKKYEVIAKYRRDRTGQQNKLNYSQNRKVIKEQQQLQNAPTSRRGTRRQVQNKRRRKKYIENPRPTIPSIKKQDHWIDLSDIWFRDTFESGNNDKKFIFKIDGEDEIGSVYTPRNKKLILSGKLHGVLTKYDTINGNTYKPEILDYERFSDFKYLSFNYKSAIQDPYILELANKGNIGNIFTTDNVLSAIMCCNRSKYSFDIVINKIGDIIFLDERNKVLSNYSVDETSQNRPTKKGTPKINLYTSLCQEATYINHVFSEQMVFHSKLEYTQKLRRTHPFIQFIGGSNASSRGRRNRGNKRQQQQMSQNVNSNQQPAAQAFSYNLFEVTDNISVVCRCGIDGFIINPNNKNSRNKDWVKIYALNQYDSNRSKTQNWRKYLDAKAAAILSQEITNNNFKCARWGICAHLSDAKYLKLGFVTRTNVHSTERHSIVGVKTYETNDFIKNKLRIRSTNEPWTIFAKFIKCIKELQDDGRYIALRDPLKQVIRVYKVSDDSFAKDDGLPSFGHLKKVLKLNQNQQK